MPLFAVTRKEAMTQDVSGQEGEEEEVVDVSKSVAGEELIYQNKRQKQELKQWDGTINGLLGR